MVLADNRRNAKFYNLAKRSWRTSLRDFRMSVCAVADGVPGDAENACAKVHADGVAALVLSSAIVLVKRERARNQPIAAPNISAAKLPLMASRSIYRSIE